MKKYNREQIIIHWTMVIVAGLFIGLLIQFARAWTEPMASPPSGNVGAPINTGSQSQAKSGGLGVMGGFVTDTNTFLARLGGNVGIGTTSPERKLDVAGFVKGRSGLCIGNDCRTSWPSGGGLIFIPPGFYAYDNRSLAYCFPSRMGGEHANVSCRLYTSNGLPYISIKIEGFSAGASCGVLEHTMVGTSIRAYLGHCGITGASCGVEAEEALIKDYKDDGVNDDYRIFGNRYLLRVRNYDPYSGSGDTVYCTQEISN